MMNNVVKALGEENVSVKNISNIVFSPAGVGDSFMSYADEFQMKQEITFRDSFHGKTESINMRSVSTVTKVCLDNNFEIRILGYGENIERGYDEKKGKKFYILYYDEEK